MSWLSGSAGAASALGLSPLGTNSPTSNTDTPTPDTTPTRTRQTSTTTDPTTTTPKSATNTAASRFMSALSLDHRKVIEAVFVHDLSHEEAADALGIPRRTLTSRLKAARKKLSELMKAVLPPSQQGDS